jgi:iron complex outermembrane recepter protein
MKSKIVTVVRARHLTNCARAGRCIRLQTFLAIALLILTLGQRVACAEDALDRKIQFNIPANTGLEDALITWGVEAGITVMTNTSTVAHKMTHGVQGLLSARNALLILLRDSGLTFIQDGERIQVVASGSFVRSSEMITPLGSSIESVSDGQSSTREEGNAQVTSAAEPTAEKYDSHRNGLAEVIVTAQKREERLQDVPVPVTAISGDSLVENDQLRLQDYYTTVPGLNVAPSSQSGQVLSIRGVTTGGGSNPTVGVMVDDIPYGSSTNLGGGSAVPDIDPGDLARVEVLRGPQGTLYGASSMGGLLKFVTVDPSTDGVTGRVQGGLSGVYNGSEVGYNVRGAINVPLNETLAVRASGFTRQDPGYVDNPVLHINGINEAEAHGGRLSSLWKPSETFSLKLSALFQNIKADGSNDVDVLPGLSGLEQNYVRGVGPYDRQVQAYSATLTAKLGSVDLTAVSGYNVNSFSDSWDYTYALGPTAQKLFGVSGSPLREDNRTRTFTQEVRISVPIAERVEWLFGVFYAHERSQFVDDILATDPVSGVEVADAEHITFPTTYEEYASFTALTYQITDKVDVQFGGRESGIRQTFTQALSGPYVGETPDVTPELDSKANAFTYLVTPRFRLSPNLMVYARLASGFRAGGANVSPGGVVPSQYDPDKTQNYEIGTKGQFFEHKLSVDASLYYIDWKDIQVLLLNPKTFLSYTTNTSRAKSQGLELSVESNPLAGLTIAAWVAWSDAVLTQGFPPTSTAYGTSGDRLPYDSRFSGSLSLEQYFPLWSSATGFIGGDVSYVGDREGDFQGVSQGIPMPRQTYPSYAKTDLRVGIRQSSWTGNLYLNNATDRRGVLNGGLGQFPPFAFTYIQPRTVGVSIVKIF